MRPDRRVYEFCGVTIASECALPDLRRGTGGRAEITITIGDATPPRAPASWLQAWRLPGGRVWLSIGRLAGGYLLRFRGQADFVVSRDGARVTVHADPAMPDATLRHLLIDQVLPLTLSRLGRLALHASAVHLPGIGTVGFAGRTGRGKSTLAAALAARGGRIVTDDCLAIETAGGGARALPGYPGLRLWPGPGPNPVLRAAARNRVAHYSTKRRVDGAALPFHGRPSPLRALFLLSPRAPAGAAMSVRRCRASVRLMGLVRVAYVLDVQDGPALAALFSALATLVTTIPVVRLRLRQGHRRLPEAADLIREYAASIARPA